MKLGAGSLEPYLDASGIAANHLAQFGLGWLSALLLMSGSPVALSALTLYAGGTIDQIGALLMMTGSRMGVSFVIFGISLLYVYRHREKEKRDLVRASMTVGISTIILTTLVYLPGMLIAIAWLGSPWGEALTGIGHFEAFNIVKALTAPILDPLLNIVPTWALFPLGLAMLLLALRLFDLAIPHFTSSALDSDEDDGEISKRWSIFGVGFVVALITMSVSVALTILVPAMAKGYVRRRHAVPYIMGANISTLGDTLLGAALLGSTGPVAVVLAELIGITLVTLILMFFFYRPVQKTTLKIARTVSENDWLAWSTLASGVIIPVVLILMAVL
jgi:hypothetical protein